MDYLIFILPGLLSILFVMFVSQKHSSREREWKIEKANFKRALANMEKKVEDGKVTGNILVDAQVEGKEFFAYRKNKANQPTILIANSCKYWDQLINLSVYIPQSGRYPFMSISASCATDDNGRKGIDIYYLNYLTDSKSNCQTDSVLINGLTEWADLMGKEFISGKLRIYPLPLHADKETGISYKDLLESHHFNVKTHKDVLYFHKDLNSPEGLASPPKKEQEPGQEELMNSHEFIELLITHCWTDAGEAEKQPERKEEEDSWGTANF